MIVNPAYAFYAKKEPLPDFNLWAGGVVNVPYTVNNAKWLPGSNQFYIYGGGYAEFTVNAKGYSKFRIRAGAASSFGSSININFYNSTGSLISAVSQEVAPNSGSYTIDIPNDARIRDVKIRILNPSSGVTVMMSGATLQE